MSDAGGYHCPACGAPADPQAAACEFCRAEVHPVRCAWCFDWLDERVRDCPRCGAAAVAAPPDAAPLHCPSCRQRELSTRSLSGAYLSSCPDCGGVWADAASFKKLCEDRSTQAAYLGKGSLIAGPKSSDPTEKGIVYRPCPACADLMNRFNFAGCSGVILDVCKPHGVWFDADELRRIVEFIRGGGLDVAREHEIEKLREERRALEKAGKDALALPSGAAGPAPYGVVAASSLLIHLLKLDAD